MRVRARAPADESEVDGLLVAAADRVAAADPRVSLPRRLAAWAAPPEPDSPALVAVDGAGRVRGHNPISSRVWPRLGWRPLWTLWEGRAGIPLATRR
jgi:hypothetical protein